MIPLTIAEVEALDAGRVDATGERITGVKIDSRLVEPGDLFVAIGPGKDFLADARSRAVRTAVRAPSSKASAISSKRVTGSVTPAA